jgi:ubiquitin C-terminal hydrolase
MCKGAMPEECKDDDNKQWFKYDDESVKLIDDIESQMLSTQKAYILFY